MLRRWLKKSIIAATLTRTSPNPTQDAVHHSYHHCSPYHIMDTSYSKLVLDDTYGKSPQRQQRCKRPSAEGSEDLVTEFTSGRLKKTCAPLTLTLASLCSDALCSIANLLFAHDLEQLLAAGNFCLNRKLQACRHLHIMTTPDPLFAPNPARIPSMLVKSISSLTIQASRFHLFRPDFCLSSLPPALTSLTLRPLNSCDALYALLESHPLAMPNLTKLSMVQSRMLDSTKTNQAIFIVNNMIARQNIKRLSITRSPHYMTYNMQPMKIVPSELHDGLESLELPFPIIFSDLASSLPPSLTSLCVCTRNSLSQLVDILPKQLTMLSALFELKSGDEPLSGKTSSLLPRGMQTLSLLSNTDTAPNMETSFFSYLPPHMTRMDEIIMTQDQYEAIPASLKKSLLDIRVTDSFGVRENLKCAFGTTNQIVSSTQAVTVVEGIDSVHYLTSHGRHYITNDHGVVMFPNSRTDILEIGVTISDRHKSPVVIHLTRNVREVTMGLPRYGSDPREYIHVPSWPETISSLSFGFHLPQSLQFSNLPNLTRLTFESNNLSADTVSSLPRTLRILRINVPKFVFEKTSLEMIDDMLKHLPRMLAEFLLLTFSPDPEVQKPFVNQFRLNENVARALPRGLASFNVNGLTNTCSEAVIDLLPPHLFRRDP